MSIRSRLSIPSRRRSAAQWGFRQKQSRFHRPRLEPLEDRRLLAAGDWFELMEVTNPANFGDSGNLSSVDVDGDTLVVGNRRDDTVATEAGAAYVYVRDDANTPANPADDSWSLSQQLLPNDLQEGDYFGESVAIEGDRLVVSADHRVDLSPSGDGLGVAYVYERINGVWELDQKIEPVGRGNNNDLFGLFNAVALEGDLIAIGSPWDGDNGTKAGAVHVFRYDASQPAGSRWVHEAKLLADDGQAEDRLGFSVAIDQGEIVVGAMFADGVASDTGAVYVYSELSPGYWSVTSRLHASDGGLDDRFGGRVAADNGLIVVGATRNDGAGATYVFVRENSLWVETKLSSSDLELNDQFGRQVDVVDGMISVLASQGNGLVPDRGAIYLFEKVAGVWTEVDKVYDSVRSPTDGLILTGHQNVALSANSLAMVNDNEVFIFARDDDHTRETSLGTDTPKSLKDARRNKSSVTTSTVNINQDLEVIDVNVRLDITHASADHLDVFLVAPDGTRVELFSDVGGTGNNFVATILDDDASSSITAAAAPFTGNFVPEGDLNSLVGLSAKGTWTLEIRDDTRGTRGTLENWSVSVLGRIILPSPPTISINDVAVIEGNENIRFIDDFISVENNVIDSPEHIDFGPDGNLYVVSRGTNEVLRFDPENGSFIDAFVVAGSGGLFRPFGMMFGPDGDLYVSSRPNNNILRFDGTTGAFLSEFVVAGSGGLDNPNGFIFSPDGNLYVTSRNTDQILRYDGTTGLFLDAFVTVGSGALDEPIGVVFGPDDNLYVSSGGNTDRVLRYDGTTGAFMDEFVSTQSQGLDRPLDLEFGSDGNLYVTSSLTHAILRFDGIDGSFIDEFVPAGSGGLSHPSAFTFGPDGNLYVGNRGSDICCQIGGNVKRYGASSQAVVTLSLSSPSGETVAVDFSTGDGTAVVGSDYTSSGGTVVFEPGVTQRSIIIPTIDDAIVEPDETFVVNLLSPSGATIGDGQGIATILDNDSPANSNVIYVYDIRFESKRGGKDYRAVFEIRSDSDADGQASATDDAAAGVSMTVEFSGQTYSGTTDSNGIFRSGWIRNLSSGGHYANAVDLVLSGFVWNPLDLDLEDDSDGDGKPDGVLSL